MRKAPLVLLLALAPAPAWGRAGGGQSYHAAPSRSSSSHGSGGGGFHPSPSYHPTPSYSSSDWSRTPTSTDPSSDDGLAVFIALVMIGVPLLLIVLFLAWLLRRARGASPATPPAPDEVEDAERGLAALRERDPAFDAARFGERCAQTVLAVNAAWVAGDLGPARALVSDGVYVRFQTQLSILRAQGVRNVMSELEVVGRPRLLAADASARWDAVEVLVAARARDATVPLQANEREIARALAAADRAPFTEVWSFLRRRGASGGPPSTRGSVLAGKCPSCGAPVEKNASARCAYCRAVLNSGEHDWVLAEITQEVEWRAQRAAQRAGVAGLDALVERDPGASAEAIEDRASVTFWKWIAAGVSNDPARLRRYCCALEALPAPPADLREVAVGSAQLRRLLVGPPDGMDRALVELRWSRRDEEAEDGYRNRADYLQLARAAGARGGDGLSSLDCSACGGPLADSDDPVCRYCGAALGGGKGEWSLEAIGDSPDFLVAAVASSA